ncbi:MAG TPA: hypothetical protein VK844_01860, partial [Hyphomicrobiales bacterium]|nr:hypothetical protein [Hyphomicrobiales bacterium]
RVGAAGRQNQGDNADNPPEGKLSPKSATIDDLISLECHVAPVSVRLPRRLARSVITGKRTAKANGPRSAGRTGCQEGQRPFGTNFASEAAAVFGEL